MPNTITLPTAINKFLKRLLNTQQAPQPALEDNEKASLREIIGASPVLTSGPVTSNAAGQSSIANNALTQSMVSGLTSALAGKANHTGAYLTGCTADTPTPGDSSAKIATTAFVAAAAGAAASAFEWPSSVTVSGELRINLGDEFPLEVPALPLFEGSLMNDRPFYMADSGNYRYELSHNSVDWNFTVLDLTMGGGGGELVAKWSLESDAIDPSLIVSPLAPNFGTNTGSATITPPFFPDGSSLGQLTRLGPTSPYRWYIWDGDAWILFINPA